MAKNKIPFFDFIKLKSFFIAEEAVNRVNMEQKKMFANHPSHMGLISKIYKAFLQLNSTRKPNHPIKKKK